MALSFVDFLSHSCAIEIISSIFLMGNRYSAAYHDQGVAFVPLVSNTLGQLGPDFLRFLWSLADHSATQASMLLRQTFHSWRLLLSSDQSGAAFQRLRGSIYTQATYKILAAVFEGLYRPMRRPLLSESSPVILPVSPLSAWRPGSTRPRMRGPEESPLWQE